MPKHRDVIARRELRRLVPILLTMRVLTEADGVALGNLCTAYSTLIRTQRMIAKQEVSAQRARAVAEIRERLFLSVASIEHREPAKIGIVNSLLAHFGMTPPTAAN